MLKQMVESDTEKVEAIQEQEQKEKTFFELFSDGVKEYVISCLINFN
jgi:hypothetical protein